MLAQRLGVWVPLSEVPDVWEAVTQLFRDYGYRRLRAKARLKFLVRTGVEKFREVLEEEYLNRRLIDGPAPAPVKHTIDHVGVQRIKNGLNAIGVAPIAGRVGSMLSAVADLMEKAGSDRARWTPFQKLVILDVADDKVDELVAGWTRWACRRGRRRGARTPWRAPESSTASCRSPRPVHPDAGARARAAPGRRRVAAGRADQRAPQRLPELVRPHPGGRHRVQGQWIDNGGGTSVEGFQVHLERRPGRASGFGRKLRQHKVTSDSWATTSTG
ncbi:hypothetical protein MTIM_52630 [Mycobacterium timonense]|uniref:assimilatory sulfite reductase (ferredoxin) n=1 Tax=Mycobacterium timonense TaxID=701043 RepID=A0A7I9ZEF5_9MYCO|nr:hypothetical protein MTIM_52630 [Mycobacterium timonense]